MMDDVERSRMRKSQMMGYDEVKKMVAGNSVTVNVMNDRGKEKKKVISIAPDDCPGILIFLKFDF